MKTKLAVNNPSVVVVRDREELLKYRQALTMLASKAIEPNVFYEPWMLFPALESSFVNSRLFLILVFVTVNSQQTDGKILCGFFPLEKRWFYQGLPLPRLTLLRHPYCFLTTPLVHKEYAVQTCDAFFSWARARQWYSPILELADLSAEGPLHEMLESIINSDEQIRYSENRFTRAVFYPRVDSDEYLSSCVSSRSRKNLRRKKKRLSEIGKLTVDELVCEDDLHAWIEEFVDLESSGWKGNSGTAFKSNAEHQEYFQTVVKQAFNMNRLHMVALRLDGRAVAMQCDLLASDGCYGFKMAFDESFSRYSPGVLLGIEHIRIMHESNLIDWMDSCTAPGHAMLDNLWLDQKLMRSILVSTSPFPGHFIVQLVPLFKKYKTICKDSLSRLKHELMILAGSRS